MPTWRRLHHTLRALICAGWLACAWLLAAAQPVTVIDRATLTVGERSLPAALPYHWDREQRNRAGAAVFELRFAAAKDPDTPWGLYFPRIGSRAEVRLNGQLLAQFGQLADRDGADFKKAPQYVAIPPSMLARDNVLTVLLVADASRRGGLAPVHVGPAAQVFAQYRADYLWRIAPSLAITFLSALVGVAALLLWLTQSEPGPDGRPRHDPLYLWAAAAELCWTLRVGDAVIEQPPLPWPLWSLVMTAAFAGWMCCMGLFSMYVAGRQKSRRARGLREALLVLFVSSIACSWLAMHYARPAIFTAWLATANFGFAMYSMYYLAAALSQPRTEQILVGVAGVANVAIGIRDWLAIRVSSGYADSTWIRYSSVLFGLALGYIVLLRFREARAQARDLTQTLQARVAQREQELETSYRQLEDMAREQARVNERAKILKDLHDGVGTHISSAIRQLQSGHADPRAVLDTLRDSMDQLKLSLDGLGTPPGDVGALLANLRYRLEPRFAGSDLRLQWDVAPLAPIERLDSAGMRHLQYMLFEALSNVLQHAQARTLTIHASQGPGGTLLRIVDDGCGFDTANAQQRGLRAMRERAAAIGATLELRSMPGATVVELKMA